MKNMIYYMLNREMESISHLSFSLTMKQTSKQKKQEV